jgi:hypothetical protein
VVAVQKGAANVKCALRLASFPSCVESVHCLCGWVVWLAGREHRGHPPGYVLHLCAVRAAPEPHGRCLSSPASTVPCLYLRSCAARGRGRPEGGNVDCARHSKRVPRLLFPIPRLACFPSSSSVPPPPHPPVPLVCPLVSPCSPPPPPPSYHFLMNRARLPLALSAGWLKRGRFPSHREHSHAPAQSPPEAISENANTPPTSASVPLAEPALATVA